ncbi:hypothetical protein [Streptomyces sp. NPDC090112]|uniref:hypothetical protein n=1 Tax=Streptomyces sp. NPDC090112 TaxID=3365949 RepID=UPI00380BCCE8
MRTHGSPPVRDTDGPGPTTEDIMNSGAAGAADPAVEPDRERGAEGLPGTGPDREGGRAAAAVYPGEATTDLDGEPPAGSAADGSTRQDAPAGPGAADDEPLLGTEETEEYRRTWSEIQGRFVDDPQEAVRSADTLVAEVMQALAGTFSTRKQGLEAQWGRGEQVATEDLRVSLQQYRSFFNRLLNT